MTNVTITQGQYAEPHTLISPGGRGQVRALFIDMNTGAPVADKPMTSSGMHHNLRWPTLGPGRYMVRMYDQPTKRKLGQTTLTVLPCGAQPAPAHSSLAPQPQSQSRVDAALVETVKGLQRQMLALTKFVQSK